MLLGRQGLPFRGQHFQGLDNPGPGFPGGDDLVHKAPGGRNIGVVEHILVIGDYFLALGLGIFGLSDLLAEDDVGRAPAPMTAISAVGQAKTMSAPRSREHMAR